MNIKRRFTRAEYVSICIQFRVLRHLCPRVIYDHAAHMHVVHMIIVNTYLYKNLILAVLIIKVNN